MEGQKNTILILGGFGFLGTNVLKYIDEHFSSKYEVVVFDKLAFHPHNISFICVTKVYSGDFSDEVLIESIFAENKIDKVLHFISTTVPALSYNAKYDIESNLIPTINLLEILVKYNVLDITFISSGGAVYGNSIESTRNKESDNLYPISSYGVTKLAIEKYMMQYAALYNLRPLILRLSNPYGKYHFSEKQGVCNVALRKAKKSEIFEVWGDGTARKDYIYVEDFCAILFKLFAKDKHSVVLNVGSGVAKSVNDLLTSICDVYPKFKWEYKEASKYDVSHFELDISELLSIIGNYSFTSFKDGFKETAEYIEMLYQS